MFTYIEIPLSLSILYPCASYAYLLKKRPQIEAQIIHEKEEIDGIEIHNHQPSNTTSGYSVINTILNTIVNPHITRSTTFHASKYILLHTKKEYVNYIQIPEEADEQHGYVKTRSVKSEADYIRNYQQYSIVLNRARVRFPLEAKHYHYKDGLYLHHCGYIATDKTKLLSSILWKKRQPLTIMLPYTTFYCLTLSWSYYGIMYKHNSIRRNQYYPPFHPTRLKNYLLPSHHP
jgi:hypothetical protein